jgi:uncharacterized protein YbcI
MPVNDGIATEPEERGANGVLSAAISNAMVQLVREFTGRGPTRVRTSIRDSVVLVLLEDTLTKGERNLVAAGRVSKVLDLRHEFQTAMRIPAIQQIELLTGRKVLAMMSANHVKPDLGAEIFVLEGAPLESLAD